MTNILTMSSTNDGNDGCTCSVCAGMYSESPSSTPSTGSKPTTLIDMPDEVISLIIAKLRDAEWFDKHELPSHQISKLERELEKGKAPCGRISRELVGEYSNWDRLTMSKQLMTLKVSADVDSSTMNDSSDSRDSDDSPGWPILDDVFHLSFGCTRLRDVIVKLGYGAHLRLPVDTMECDSCVDMPEEKRRRVRYVLKRNPRYSSTIDVMC